MCVCRNGRGTSKSEAARGSLRIQDTTVCIDRGTRAHGKVCEFREIRWGFDGETGSLHICMPICGGMQHAEERMRYLGRTNSSVSLSLGGRLVSRFLVGVVVATPLRPPSCQPAHPPIDAHCSSVCCTRHHGCHTGELFRIVVLPPTRSWTGLGGGEGGVDKARQGAPKQRRGSFWRGRCR